MKQKLLLLFACLLGTMSAWADTAVHDFSVEIEGTLMYFKYLKDDNGDPITDSKGNPTCAMSASYKKDNGWQHCDLDNYTGDFEVPTTVRYNGTDYTVTTIGQYAFYRSKCTSIIIPGQVTNFEDRCFYQSYDLLSIEFPAGTTSIPGSACCYCEKLETVILPDGVTAIGNYAFDGCYKLSSITLPESVQSIGAGVFHQCMALESINLPNGITSIGDYTFGRCKKLKNINLPESLVSIGPEAFLGCIEVTNIELPEGLVSIGDDAFGGCGITSIKIPASVQDIGETAFACGPLTEITLEGEPSNIGDFVFGFPWEENNIEYVYLLFEPTQDFLDKLMESNIDNSKIHAQSYVLTEGETYSLTSAHDGIQVDYTRNFASKSWQALFLPVALPYDEWSKYGTVATLTGVSKDGEGNDVLDWVTLGDEATVAGTPYIFQPKNTGEVTFSVSNATLVANSTINSITPKYSDNTEAGFTLNGTYATINTMADDHYFALSNGIFRYTEDNSKTLKPYRIYISGVTTTTPISMKVNGIVITDIEGIEVDDCVEQATSIGMVNLFGQPVGDNYKGIVIMNGKKIIRK